MSLVTFVALMPAVLGHDRCEWNKAQPGGDEECGADGEEQNRDYAGDGKDHGQTSRCCVTPTRIVSARAAARGSRKICSNSSGMPSGPLSGRRQFGY